MTERMLRAFVTLLTSDDYAIGVLLLAHSLRRHAPSVNTIPLLVIHTKLSPCTVKLLHQNGCHTLLVPPLQSTYQSHVKEWNDVALTKLRIYQLIMFDRVVYIDSDALVTSSAVYDLFDVDPRVTFAAAPDIFPPDAFNAGVLVIKPSLDAFRLMLQKLPRVNSYDGGDTGLLNNLYKNWNASALYTLNSGAVSATENGIDPSCQYPSSTSGHNFPTDTLLRLPFSFNVQRLFVTYTRKNPLYWKCIQPIHVAHFSSLPKPWQMLNGISADEITLDQLNSFSTTDPLMDIFLSTLKEFVLHKSNTSELIPTFPIQSLNLVWPTFSCTPQLILGSLLNLEFLGSLHDHCLDFKEANQNFWIKTDDAFVNAIIQNWDAYRSAVRISVGRNPFPSVSSPPFIPLSIHQIWLGKNALPSQYTDMYVSKWKEFELSDDSEIAPSWTYKLWKDDDLAGFPYSQPLNPNEFSLSEWRLHVQTLFDNSTNVAARADIFRYDLLLAFGGLYLDVDFECIPKQNDARKLFTSIHNNCSFYAGFSHCGVVEINNGLFASAPNHPILYDLLRDMRITSLPTIPDVIDRSGPGHFTRTINSFLSSDNHGSNNVVIFPPTVFYPLPNSMRVLANPQDRSCYTRLETLAMHHWGCSWQTTTTSVDPPVKNNSTQIPGIADISSSLPSYIMSKLSAFLG